MFGLDRKAYLKDQYRLFKELLNSEEENIKDYIKNKAIVDDNIYVRSSVTLNFRKANSYYELQVGNKTLIPSLNFKDDKELLKLSEKCNEYFTEWLMERYPAVAQKGASDSQNNSTIYKVRLFCAMDLRPWLQKNYKEDDAAVTMGAMNCPKDGIYYDSGDVFAIIYNTDKGFATIGVRDGVMVIETNLDGGENSYKFDLLEYDKAIAKYNSITNEKLVITIQNK